MQVSLCGIACVDKDFGIGYQNDLIIRDKKDLQQFKKLTNHGVLVMGRKTHESIRGGKGLPNRIHIVLTKQTGLVYGKNVIVVHSVEEVLQLLSETFKNRNKFVVGGGEIYKLFAPYLTEFYLTKASFAKKDVDTHLASSVIENMQEVPLYKLPLTDTLVRHYYRK